MLRAVLTTARRRPRLSRLLSAAATSAVPAPNQQPEVFCNQVRLAVASASPWTGPSGRRGLSFPSQRSLHMLSPAYMAAQCIFPARDSRRPLSAIGAAAVGVVESAPGRPGPMFTQKAQGSQLLSKIPPILPYPSPTDLGQGFRKKSCVRTALWPFLLNQDFGVLS